MVNNLETEYKLLVTKEQFEKLRNKYNELEYRTQINSYYDTKDSLMKEKKCSMRIREVNGEFIFTLKTPAHGSHMEHECLVSENSVEAFNDPEIMKLFDQYQLHGNYIKIGECITQRAIYATPLAELCFDINEYRETIDYEIEYEIKESHDGVSAFNEILSAVDCVYERNCASKIARACQ